MLNQIRGFFICLVSWQLVGDVTAERELLILEINTHRSSPGPKQEKESAEFGSGGQRRPWSPSTYSFFSESPFQILSGIGDTTEERRREETNRRDRDALKLRPTAFSL